MQENNKISNGVMLNVYPDSIGTKFSDSVTMLTMSEFKDTFSLLVYSQIPYLFGLVILFTLELVIFGDYLFSKNPTPFTIKGSISYLFFTLEIAIVIWSILLVLKAFQAQTHHLLFSIFSTLTFVVLFWSIVYLCSMFVFTI